MRLYRLRVVASWTLAVRGVTVSGHLEEVVKKSA
jgi:hypothetical protein